MYTNFNLYTGSTERCDLESKPLLNKPNATIKYLVQILQTNNNLAPSHLGFIGDENCPVCIQYFDGTEKYIPYTKQLLPKDQRGFKQMPKVFNNKKHANNAIKQAQKSDIAFGICGKLYELVPIEIN